MGTALIHRPEEVALDALSPHPRNYRSHPAEQQAHIVASLREHGVYRNVVVAKDGTILAGHGVVEAARAEGLSTLPVVRLDVDPESAEALKVLAGDNAISQLAVDDSESLADLLTSIGSTDWLGTGFDDGSFAALVSSFATTPDDTWTGMPEFVSDDRGSFFHCTVHFRSDADAAAFFELLGHNQATSLWWPESDGHVGSNLHQRYVNEADAA